MEKRNETNFALANVAIQMLVKDDDHYRLHEKADVGLKAALDALFADPKLDPKAEIENLLKLGSVLESDFGSIEVADAILAYLAKDDRALSVLGISTRKAQNARAQFQQFAGAVEQKREAPIFGEVAPSGSIKVSSLLQPGREPRKTPTNGVRTRRSYRQN